VGDQQPAAEEADVELDRVGAELGGQLERAD
jgi:hypothetical protein